MSLASGSMKVKKAKKASVPVHEDEIEEEREQDELEAEMRALQEIRNAKALSGGQHVEQTEAMLEQHKQQHNQSASTQFSYNKKALQMACEGLASSQLPFLETLCVASFPVSEHDDNDDLEREMAFYNQSLLAVQEGRRRLTELGVPTRRPPDFFCEHVKSDAHMGRVKDRLILENRKIESFEARKQQEISRKYEREIQAAKRKAKAAEDADGKGNGDDKPRFHRGRDEGEEGGRGNDRPGKKFKGGDGDKSRKRQVMDKMYGSGIKDRMKSKMNDKKSLNDLSQFHPKGGKAVRRSSGSFSPRSRQSGGGGGGFGGGGGGGKKKGGKPNRPGKEARKQKRMSSSSA